MAESMIPDWDTYFLGLSRQVALRSKDPNRQVGAVIVGPRHREIRATGYNGFPRRVQDDPGTSRWQKPEKYLWVVHAEANAIVAAARTGASVDQCHLYVTDHPCIECAKLIVQSGIEIVTVPPICDDPRPVWLTPEIELRVRTMFDEAGVLFQVHPLPPGS